MDRGYLYPKDLEQFFKGLDANEIFNKMKKIDDGKILASIISHIIKTKGLVTSRDISIELGITYINLVNNFAIQKMGGLKKVYVEEYLKPLARKMITSSNNGLELLRKIGWAPAINPKNFYADGTLKPHGVELVDSRMRDLFGVSFERAKIIFSSGYLGDFDSYFI